MDEQFLLNVIKKQKEGDHQYVINMLSPLIKDADPRYELIFGLSLHLDNQIQRGSEFLDRALSYFDNNKGEFKLIQSEVAFGQFLKGNVTSAIEILEKVIFQHGGDAVSYGRLGAAYLTLPNVDKAIECYKHALTLEPSRAAWHANLGAALVKKYNSYDEALSSFEEALRLDPSNSSVAKQRDQALKSLGRADEIIDTLEAELSTSQNSGELRLRLSFELSEIGRRREAIALLLEARLPPEEITSNIDFDNSSSLSADLKLDNPDDIRSLEKQIALRKMLADLFSATSQYMKVVKIIDETLLLSSSKETSLIINKVNALLELRRFEDADKLIIELEEESAETVGVRVCRAHFYSETEDYDSARLIYEELLERFPDDTTLMMQLGQILLWMGDLERASELFLKASEANPVALAQLVAAKKIPKDPSIVEKMISIADSLLVSNQIRITMGFALAEIFDKNKEYDRAFSYLALANSLTDETLNYDCEKFQRNVERNKAVFDKRYFEKLPEIRESDRTPIFIVGMPRSGTTLTEQILCSHNAVFGAGELPLMGRIARMMPRIVQSNKAFPNCIQKFSPHLREEAARFYLHGLCRYDRDAPFVVDKMPHNFMYVGLIRSIFPGAKVIHIMRDPRDTALSNFQQNFKAKNGGLGYAFSLEKIGHEINSYCSMMDHWREVLPDFMLEIRYEDLVSDQEGTSRQLLDFVGLEWDENVKNFHKTDRAVRTASVAQVRQKIYNSSRQKWRNYERYLTPLLNVLRPEVTAMWD